MDPWIFKKLYNKKQIENYSLHDCINFLNIEGLGLYLHDYDILCIGYKNKIKHMYQLQILASSPRSKMLQGPHELIIYDEQRSVQFWVWSLTTLRKNFFEFNDRLSFERSAFLVLRKSEILLRLQCVRSILKIMRKHPHQIHKKLLNEEQFFTKPYDTGYIEPYHKVVNRVSARIKDQQKHLLEKSYTSYLREFENTYLTKDQIYQKFRSDILANLDKLHDSTPTTENPQDHQEQVEHQDHDSILTCMSEASFELHEIDFCY